MSHRIIPRGTASRLQTTSCPYVMVTIRSAHFTCLMTHGGTFLHPGVHDDVKHFDPRELHTDMHPSIPLRCANVSALQWFLFLVGASMALSFEKRRRSVADKLSSQHGYTLTQAKLEDSKHALVRSLKLFALGVVMQGGDFLDPSNYTYGT